MESIRTFIAVELPGDIKKRLDEVEDSLKALRIGAKWVAPEWIHPGRRTGSAGTRPRRRR